MLKVKIQSWKIFLIIFKKSTVVATVESIIMRNDIYMVIDILKLFKKLKEVFNMNDNLYDWAYIGMPYMGMSEEIPISVLMKCYGL